MIFTFYNSRLKSHVQHTLIFENESLREKARSCIPLTKLKEKSTNIFNSKSNSDKNRQFSIWNVFILLWVDFKIFLNFLIELNTLSFVYIFLFYIFVLFKTAWNFFFNVWKHFNTYFICFSNFIMFYSITKLKLQLL